MKIYVVRHGETDGNVKKQLQGRMDIPLNETGRHQIEQLRKKLQGVLFTQAYSSPLKRAQQTAKIILDGDTAEVQIDSRLSEISFGCYEGLSYMEGSNDIMDESFKNFFEAPQKYIPPFEGESLDELTERIGSFMQDLRVGNISGKVLKKDDTLLITTHGAAMCALLGYVDGRKREEFWKAGVPANGELALLSLEGKNFTIVEEGIKDI